MANQQADKSSPIDDAMWRILAELPIGVAIVNRDQQVLHANEAFQDFLGYSEAELRKMSLLEVTDPATTEALERGMEALFAGERPYFDLETRYFCKDGQEVWGNPVRMLRGVPEGDAEPHVLLMVVDITDRKRLERQMEHGERLRSMGLLVGSLAHDFNNIFTVIQSFGQLAQLSPGDPDTVAHSLEKIVTACQKGAELATQFVRFGRQEASGEMPTDVNDLIRKMESFLQRLVARELTVELQLDEACPPVDVEASQVHQLLMNLTLNARDAMSDGGRLTIETGPIEGGAPGVPAVLERRLYAVVRVCDDGQGIPAEVLPHIFKPFFTTKGEEGTGLGLATVASIAQKAGGHVDVHSSPGGRTCFTIYLPAAPGASSSDGGKS